MSNFAYHLADVVMMKKPHACQTNKWEILRLGADIRLKCMGCGHLIMMPRAEFNRKLKKVLSSAADPVNQKLKYYLDRSKIRRPKID